LRRTSGDIGMSRLGYISHANVEPNQVILSCGTEGSKS
jgi:hypothetical protein